MENKLHSFSCDKQNFNFCFSNHYIPSSSVLFLLPICLLSLSFPSTPQLESKRQSRINEVLEPIYLQMCLAIKIWECNIGPQWLSRKESAFSAGDVAGARVWSLGWEDPLEKEMATLSSILAWKVHEQRSLQSRGSQRVGHDWARVQTRHKVT